MIRKHQGSAFVTVIAVLGVIFFAASLFMTATIDEGRQTSFEIHGLHANSLAEAVLERTMFIVASDSNQVNPETANPESLGIRLRLPANAQSGVTLGLGTNLGADELMDLPDKMVEEIIFTKEDLLKPGNELEELVQTITEGGVVDWDATVKVKVEKAFKIGPGSEFSDFKIPGVEIGWNLRPGVKSFLEGKGYFPLVLAIPDTINWLEFHIPVKIGAFGMSFTIFDINVVNWLDDVVPAIPVPISIPGVPQKMKLGDIARVDTAARVLLNGFFGRGKAIYPFKVPFDKIPVPKTIAELWPSGVSIENKDYESYIEKYGQINFECEASITYKNGHTAKRRIHAVKDFKVADCEPPAPMYSCFISNLNNERLLFNNFGGQFTVTNMDFGGIWGKVKEVFTNAENELPKDELEKRQIPGLIRVNYIDNDPNNSNPMIVNVSMLGDWGAPDAVPDNRSGIAAAMKAGAKVAQGVEAFLMLDSKRRLAMAGGSASINAEVDEREPDSNEGVPDGMSDIGTSDSSSVGGMDGGQSVNYGLNTEGIKTAEIKGKFGVKTTEDLMKKLTDVKQINMIPNVGKMGANLVELALTLALKPLVGGIVHPKNVRVPDCFEKWEMPYMGTSNSVFTIPTHGCGMNKTHFFGPGGMYPTMTREIEGYVLKRYRQWKMCIIGMGDTGRIPISIVPLVLVPPPPIVIPIWYSRDILNKYDYNFPSLKARKGDVDGVSEIDLVAYEYDPKKLENLPPNLYTSEQYAKKATYYYESYDAFLEDLENRFTMVNGKKVLPLNGVTYISGTMGSSDAPFNPGGDLYVVGKGMIVCSGNLFLGCNIMTLDKSAEDRTLFSLILRNGGLIINKSGKAWEIEGSLYTEKGIYLHNASGLHIVGNWVTNKFNKAAMSGTIKVDYVSTKVRASLGSLHPERGKFDPKRYHVSFSPVWASWRAK